MGFLELAKDRYSVRSFKDIPVSEEDLAKILEAGHVAPTGKNAQPQRILVLNQEETLQKLKDCTKCHFDAPLALLVCADTTNCYVRPYDQKSGAEIDVCVVTTHMMMEAQELGVGSTWVMHFNPIKMREAFNVPEEFEMTALLVMGYPSETAKPAPFHDKFEDVNKLVFYNQFNK